MSQEEKNKISNTTPGALYPKNDLNNEEIESYKVALDAALKDDRINNIAVTASYGVGKSTVLESYFNIRKESYPWYIKLYNASVRKVNALKKQYLLSPKLLNEIEDYEFINLPNFFDNLESSELQKKVIEQLLFKTTPKNYPFSKLKRIKDTSIVIDIANLLISIFVVASSFYLYLKATNKQNFFKNSFLNFSTFDILLAIAVSLLTLYFLVWFIRKVRVSLSKSTVVGKGTIGPLEISNTPDGENSGTNVFNIFSEELLYFFRKSPTKIIVFEDLDRFGRPEIFQELRELNTNINKRQPKVVFIYSLQDKVFENIIENEHHKAKEEKYERHTLESNALSDNLVRSKAKFFDFVIPIFPVTSFYNSSSTLEEEIKKYDIFSKQGENIMSKSFLRKIGFFLKDKRMIILIVSEFHTYLKILFSSNKTDVDLELLFSMIVYKNFYADDFEKIGHGNSLLNTIFDNSHVLYDEFINIKTGRLEEDRVSLEKRIAKLEHHVEFEISSILNGYYWHLKTKHKAYGEDIQNQYFTVNQKSYYATDANNFFSDIANLPDSTLISTHSKTYGSNSRFTVEDAFNIAGESMDFRILVEKDAEGRTTSVLLSELKAQLYEIRNEINDTATNAYRLSTGTILKELAEMYEKEDKLGKALLEIKKDNFKRFLFYNDYLTQNFYSYISPVIFSENAKDSIFIESVLSYNDMGNYSLTDIETTIKELDLAGANYSYAYSSNLLSYLLHTKGYTLQKSLIIDKVVEKNDFKFWDNLLSYSKKNNLSILEGLYLLADKSKSFFIKSFTQISVANNKISVETLMTNLEEMISRVGEPIVRESISFLINDPSSFHNIINTFTKLNDDSILERYREYFTIQDVLPLIEATKNENNRELVNYIYRNALYEPSYRNMVSFGKLYDMEVNFDLYTKRLKDINVQLLYVSNLRIFFESLYNKGSHESYTGLLEFIDFSLGKHDFYNKFEKESLSEIDMRKKRYECLVFFSKISFVDENYEANGKIIEKLKLVDLINNGIVDDKVLRELIRKNRLVYSYELIEVLSQNKPSFILDYFLSVYTVYPEIISDRFEEIEHMITEKDKLTLFKNTAIKEDYLKIGSFLSGSMEIWESIIQEDHSFFDNKMTHKVLEINSFPLHKLLFIITSGIEQARILNTLLTNFPKKLSLLEFEKILGIESYFSKHSPDGRVHHKNNSSVPKPIMDVLDELGIIGYKNDKKDFIFRKEVSKYFS